MENLTIVQILKTNERRTNVDSVFDYLYDEIISMRLLPGTKISEAEIAKKFEISRQPVRDAFSRLDNLDLLLIRPQKATEVKRFSSMAINTARFVRAAVEAEVLRRAAQLCTPRGKALLDASLDEQRIAVKANSYDNFRVLDYQFHKLLCNVAEVDFAADVIAREKEKVDRLCILGLTRDERLDQLMDDHIGISQMVSSNDEQGAVKAGMLHLSRLDSTINAIRDENADYFDD
ncbi:MAG: GntR family transcriptional regulator [Granulosicoccus sp.]